MLSIVATETSALTIISVPGLAARGDLTFLQLSFGYLVGRIGVAAFLLPGYFEGTQDTAYQRLERRFGTGARRTASGVFLLTRALADCVRIFATAIPLAIITQWSLAAGILAIGIVTVIYTWVGGPGPAMRRDALYPTFATNRLPAGLAGLVIAGILAAAMSSHASAVNSLASASTQDFYAPLTGRHDPTHLLWVGRWFTLMWTAVLVAGAMAFRNQNTPVLPLAPTTASITYGGLLGTYLLGGLWPRARERDVIVAIVVSVLAMTPIVLGLPWRVLPGLAWPWFVPLGTAVTVAVGMVSSMVVRRMLSA